MSISYNTIPTHVYPGEIHRMYPRLEPKFGPHFRGPLPTQKFDDMVIKHLKKGGNPLAIATAAIGAIQTADRIARVVKPGSRIEDAIDKKYGESGGPWWARGLRAAGKFTREKFGWGIESHTYKGIGTLPELKAAIRAAAKKAIKMGHAPAKYGSGSAALELAVKEAIDSVKKVWTTAKKG